MIIHSIEFNNWQGYYGKHKFSFQGTGNRNGGFILGDNTVGKTAFWEAIHFALYDRVPKRKNPKKFKPFVAENSSEKPLMNCDLFGKKNASFSIAIVFLHDDKKYTLVRGYRAKYENRNVTKTGDLINESYLSDDSISGPGKFIQDNKKWIQENILPERLAKFFLFDGERLEEYEELMEKEEDVQLRLDIEDIVRTPILKQGGEIFNRIKNKFRADLSEEKMKNENNKKDKKKAQDLQKRQKEIKEAQEINNQEINGYVDRIKEIDEWLLDNDVIKEAAIRLKNANENKQKNVKIVKGLRDDISREVAKSWKLIISEEVNSSINKLEENKEAQTRSVEKIGVMRLQENELKLRLDGNPCPTCRIEREKPNEEKKTEINRELEKLGLKIKRKLEVSKYPTAEEYYLQKEGLSKFKSSEKNLRLLLEKEDDLMSAIIDGKKINEQIERAKSDISEEKEIEVRKYTVEKENLEKKKDGALVAQGKLKKKYEDIMEDLQKYINHREINDSDSLKIRRLAKSIEISELISNIFKETLDEYREKMREEVEKRSSETFMQISNNADNYDGLKISENFTVSILNRKKTYDAGSQAQSLVMAYSIIDALSSCSGFEFPMVVDTPGRGLARKNMNAVFEYFSTSEKQIIFLPNDSELAPEKAVEKYGERVASIYQLEKIADDRTKVELIVNNLEEI